MWFRYDGGLMRSALNKENRVAGRTDLCEMPAR